MAAAFRYGAYAPGGTPRHPVRLRAVLLWMGLVFLVPFLSAQELPFAFGVLGGKTLLVGWTYDSAGRPAVELLDSSSGSMESALAPIETGTRGVRRLLKDRVRLGRRNYLLALKKGDLVLSEGSSEMRVPLANLISDGWRRLASECTPLSPESAYCFRMVLGGTPAVNIWRQSAVFDFEQALDPGAPRPPKGGPMLPRPVRSVTFPGARPKTVALDGESYRISPRPDGRSVEVESLR